jgi:hypothetical protein
VKFFGRLPVKIEKGPPDRLFEARAEVVTAAWVRQGCNMRPNSLVQSTRADAIIRAVPVGAWRSPVSALVWGTRGRGFKSRRPDQKIPGNQGQLSTTQKSRVPEKSIWAPYGHPLADV